jgi:hypothetical protein
MEKPVDGVVRQLDQIGGIVIECSVAKLCEQHNANYSSAKSLSNGCKEKDCLLSVENHGERCMAYPEDSNMFLIDKNVANIKQLPTA